MKFVRVTTEFPVLLPEYAPGSSIVETGSTPTKSVVLSYPSIAAMADAGGQCRVNGVIHFERTIFDGKNLGEGICIASLNLVKNLIN